MRIRTWRCKDKTAYQRRIEPLLPAFLTADCAQQIRPALREALHYTTQGAEGEVVIRLYQSEGDLRLTFSGSSAAYPVEAVRDYLLSISEHESLGQLYWRKCAVRMRMERRAYSICEMLAIAEYVVLDVDVRKVELVFRLPPKGLERRSLCALAPYLFLERNGAIF